MKRIKIIDLLCLISNGEEVPKKIKYDGVIFENNGCNCYLNGEDKSLSYCVEIPMFLNDEVEILEDEEDKDIPLIPDDELYITGNSKQDYNFKVLQEKINQLAEEFNEYRRNNENI